MNRQSDKSPEPSAPAPAPAAPEGEVAPAPRGRGLARVAIVGRPNVGKSTLVNRILGRRAAITQETPGVTRDRVTYQAEWAGRAFELVDTGGGEPRAKGLQARVVAQAARAMAAAGLLVFVVDATTGISPEDAAIAARLRRGEVPVLLVANKVDGPGLEPQIGAFWSLGLGEPLPVSSLHGRGSGDVLDAMVERLGPERRQAPDDDHPVVEHDGRGYRVVDTAGMRRSFQQAEGADYFALVRSFQAVDRADVALLVLDAPAGVTEQDQKVAVRAVEAGAGVVLVANKWDLMDDEARERFDLDLERRLHFVDWAPLLRTAARTGRNVDKVWQHIDAVLAQRAQRVPTAALNRWLEEASGRTPPPPSRGRSVKIRYVTQARVNPPEFVFFTTGPLSPAYRRILSTTCGAPSGSRARRSGSWTGSASARTPGPVPEAVGARGNARRAESPRALDRRTLVGTAGFEPATPSPPDVTVTCHRVAPSSRTRRSDGV